MFATRTHIRTLAATLLVAALALASTFGLAACQKEGPQHITLTVVCTDEVREFLAAGTLEDTQAFLQAAGDEFAASYTDVDLTIKVVAVPAGTLSTVIAPELAPATEPEPEPEPGTEPGTEPEPGTEGDGSMQITDPDSPESGLPGDKETSESEAEEIGAPTAQASLKVAFADWKDIFVGVVDDTIVPDVVFGSYEEIVPAIYAGHIAPANDILLSGVRSSMPASYLDAGYVPANGLTYMVPFTATQMVLVFDEDLFKACGLDAFVVRQGSIGGDEGGDTSTVDGIVQDAISNAVVQTWSPAQWMLVLETLAQKLPALAQERQVTAYSDWETAVEVARTTAKNEGGDEAAQAAAAAEVGEAPHLTPLYPMMMFGQGSEGADYIAALMHMFGGSFFDQDGYALTETAEGVAAATWIALGAAHGYYPPDVESLTYADCAQLFANGQLGIFAVDSTQIEQLYRDAVEVPGEGEEGSPELTRHYGFVAFPSWSMEALDGVKEQLAATKINLDDLPSGSGMTSDYSGLIPAEFTGFAVVDNGNDLALKIAKEFVSFILNSDEWLIYSGVEGQMPADSYMVDLFAKQLGVVGEFRYMRDQTFNVSSNVPEWEAMLEAFQQAIGSIVSGGKTPVESAAAIDKACNAVLEPAYRDITLHE